MLAYYHEGHQSHSTKLGPGILTGNNAINSISIHEASLERTKKTRFQDKRLGIHTFLHLLVLICELFSLTDHLLDLFLGQTALVVGDGDLLALAGALQIQGAMDDY